MEYEEEIWKKVEEYMHHFDTASIQKQSYDFFINHRLSKIVEEEPTLEVPMGDVQLYRVKFGQVFVDKPYIIDEDRQVRYITPNEARLRDLTYSSAISVNIRTCTVVKNGNEEREVNAKEFFKVLIARIPTMIGTSKCNLFDKTPEQRREAGECDYDTGGYFIIKGKERVLVSQERMNHNIVYVFDQKPSSKFSLVSEIRSMSEETGHSVLIQMKITNSVERKILMQIPYISQEIPLGYIFKAFGFSISETLNILKLNVGSLYNKDTSVMKIIRGIIRDVEMIDTMEKAVAYIAQFAVHNVSKDRKLFYVNQILRNELFPHLGITSTKTQKGLFMGHMFSKLLYTHLQLRPMDDRDHISNKRIEASGHLLSELFRTLFKRFVRAIQPQLAKRPDVMVVISRMNIITQGIRHCFSTGNWGIPKSSYIRTGVSQILSRLTYNAFLSHLRRILIPIGKEGKNTKIRQLHPSQIGFICPHETPEGHCLTGETEILLEDGISTVPLKHLSSTSNIISVDAKKGHVEVSEFYNYFTVKPESLYRMKLTNGVTIRASGLHPFLASKYIMKKPVWRQTQDLKVGDMIAYLPIMTKYTDERSCIVRNLVSLKELQQASHGLMTSINTDWKYLHVAARLFGATCLCMDRCYRSNGLQFTLRPEMDIKSVVRDFQLIMPWSRDITCHLNRVMLGPLPSLCFLELTKTWMESYILPNWILDQGDLVAREFLSGFLSYVEYSPIDMETHTSCRMKICVEDNRLYPLGNVICQLLQRFCPRWDLVTYKDMGYFECVPHDSETLFCEFTRNIGYRYHSSLQNKLFRYMYTVYLNIPCTYIPSVSPFLMIPISSMEPLPPTEMTMDFTTTSEHHSFVANGMVTHNSAGIVKNMALSTQITPRVDTVYLRMVIEQMKSIMTDLDLSNNFPEQDVYKIFVNGNWIGISRDDSVYKELIRYKFQNRIPSSVSVSISYKEREILVFGDEGRMVRPLFDVTKMPSPKELSTLSLQELLDRKIMVFLDSHEIENQVIAMNPQELADPLVTYNYCEVHASFIMGLCVSLIPYVDHTQAPRVTYHASMGKQAIGYYSTTHSMRVDTVSHVLCYPERPLIRTHYGHLTGCDDLATGNNLVVAICMYTGFNQEDSVIVNQSAIDRGLFRSMSYRTIVVEERKKSTTHTEMIGMPDAYLRVKSFNYSKLNENGIVKVGAYVGSGDVMVGRVQMKTSKNGSDEKLDTSVIVKSGEEGYIDKVVITSNPDGYKIVKIKIRTLKILEIGDKVASRSAQKGTVGMVYRQEDMPFTSSGIVPDLIINPLCIPSRMTINQLIECLGAKSAAHKARFRYSTPFSSHSTNVVEYLRDELEQCGFEKNGNETLFNGFTGKAFESQIFIGPTYYHRLKHLVSAKIHARNHGSLQALTRQPLEGRSRDGGLRFGEMERDCMISHGVSRFLTERLFDMSDKFTVPVCSDCGGIPHSLDICNSCESTRIRRVPLPYACKLLFQELNAMGIKINLLPSEDGSC